MSDAQKELQWPPILSRRGDGWVNGTAGVTAVGGVLVGEFSGALQTVVIVGTIIAAVLGVCIVVARHERTNHLNAVDVSLADQVNDRWLLLVKDRIGALLLQVAKVVNTDDPLDRRNLASSARVSILTLASADAIGTRGGVRMNLFRLSEDRSEMRPEDFGSTGRSGESARIFRPEDETMVATLLGQSRFIENTYSELGPEEAAQLSYETFGTTPVGSPNGTIWGVLTVDAPKTGDLDRVRDMALMNVFASLIAVTYSCESYSKPRR